MAINRQIFLSFANGELTMTAGPMGNSVSFEGINNYIWIAWGDTIEWLLAPYSGIDKIFDFPDINPPDLIDMKWNQNSWIWSTEKMPATQNSNTIFTYSIQVILPNGNEQTFSNLNMAVSPTTANYRRYKSQIRNIYIGFREPQSPQITVITSKMMGISQNPDGPFLHPDDDKAIVNCFESDILTWQFASPPYSFGGCITGMHPPMGIPIFSSLLFSEGISLGAVYSDGKNPFNAIYSFTCIACFADAATRHSVAFTIDPKIRVNPQP